MFVEVADHRQGFAVSLRRLSNHQAGRSSRCCAALAAWKLRPSPAWSWAQPHVASPSSSTALSVPRVRRWLVRLLLMPAAPSLPDISRRSRDTASCWKRMGVKPLLQLDMRLGEGTGAVLTFPLIEVGGTYLQRDGHLRLGRSQRGKPGVKTLRRIRGGGAVHDAHSRAGLSL